MRNHALKTAFFLLLLPLSAVFCAALPFPAGSELSKAIEHDLINAGFSPSRANLTPTGQDVFPFNIILNFPASQLKPVSSGQKKTLQTVSEDSRTSLILCFTQKDAEENKETLFPFFKKIQSSSFPFSLTVLFSALDDSPISGNDHLCGTEVFARTYEDPDHAAAIVLSLGSKGKTTVTAGSSNDSSPSWLLKRIVSAFKTSGDPIEFPHPFFSLYRLGVLPDDARMASFIHVQIPCASVSFAADTSLNALLSLLNSYGIQGTENWDRHYAFFHIKNSTVLLNERFFVIIFLVFGVVSLLILSSFSFTGNRSSYMNDFIRTWYVIPLTLAVSFISLEAGQFLCPFIPFIMHAPPIVLFGIKLFFSCIFISVLFIVQEQLRLPVAPFIYGYLLTLMAVINVFVFSTLDLSLFILFAAEYVIIYIARTAKKIIPLFLFVILMLLPFLPYAVSLLNGASSDALRNIVLCSPSGNIFLSCALFPFQIMYLRILVRLNLFGKVHELPLKKVFLRAAISIAVLITVSSMPLFLIQKLFPIHKAASSSSDFSGVLFTNAPSPEHLAVSTYETSFRGMTTRHVLITTDKEAVRCTVSVSANGKTPVYDSLYEYDINEQTQTASFLIPDYPPQSFTIDYAAESEDDSNITVTVYFSTAVNGVYSRETATSSAKNKKTAER